MAVRVQVPLAVQMEEVLNMKMLGTFLFLLAALSDPRYSYSRNQWFVGVARIKVA